MKKNEKRARRRRRRRRRRKRREIVKRKDRQENPFLRIRMRITVDLLTREQESKKRVS